MSNSNQQTPCPECGRIHGKAVGHMMAEIERTVAFILDTQHDEVMKMGVAELMRGILTEFLNELGRMNTVLTNAQDRCKVCEKTASGRKIVCAHCTAEDLMLLGVSKNLVVTISMAEAWMIAHGLIKP